VAIAATAAGGTVLQGGRDAILARLHIGKLGTRGLVAGVALALTIAAGVTVYRLGQVDQAELSGRWEHAGGLSGMVTVEASVLTVDAAGAYRLRGGVRMAGFGAALGTTLETDCRGNAETAFGGFSFHERAGTCGDFAGKLVRDGRALEGRP
jgi:hypothetical protein